MAYFIATKARILVTVATAGAMFAGVAGLQAQAQEATALLDRQKKLNKLKKNQNYLNCRESWKKI
jgi:hypothetical protein